MSNNTPTTPRSRYITVQEAAHDFCVSDQFLWKLIRNDKLPAKYIRLGGAIRIERASWEAFLESGNEFVSPPAAKIGRPKKDTPALDLQLQREISHAPSV